MKQPFKLETLLLQDQVTRYCSIFRYLCKVILVAGSHREQDKLLLDLMWQSLRACSQKISSYNRTRNQSFNAPCNWLHIVRHAKLWTN